jgi:intein/homing endonuclease
MRLTFEDLLEADLLEGDLLEPLLETLTYDQLFRMSEPKRFQRSFHVHMPPMEIDQYQTDQHWVFAHYFNAKSDPGHSTTGLRHRGYLKFQKPKRSQAGKNTPLSQLAVEVDCMCVSGNTPVLMSDGTYKPISEIRPGDFVYTHKGRIRPVIGNVARRLRKDEKVYNLTVTGFPGELIVTGNHPFYALRGNRLCACGCGQSLWDLEKSYFKKYRSTSGAWLNPKFLLNRRFKRGHNAVALGHKNVGVLARPATVENPFAWVRADDFREKEWFLAPWIEPPETTVHFDRDLARLLGYFIAEGHCYKSTRLKKRKQETTYLTFNLNELGTLGIDVQRICRKLGYTARLNTKHAEHAFRITVKSVEFKHLCLDLIGTGSDLKCLSPQILAWDDEALKGLVVGAFLGDGSSDKVDGEIDYTTVNFKLATQISLILSRLRLYHRITNGSKRHGKAGRGKTSFTVSVTRGSSDLLRSWAQQVAADKFLNETKRTRKKFRGIREGQLRTMIKRVQSNYTGTVWDLCVDEDHSFIANGIVVANCPDYRYKWAWANKQKRAGKIGPNSLNQCINKAPRITNPTGKPGLCKHLLATRDYIYGLLSGFPEEVGASDRLDQITKQATKRWIDYGDAMARGRERAAQLALARARRNIGLPPDQAPATALGSLHPPALPELPVPGAAQPPAPPQPPQPPQPPAPSLAVPPGQRGRQMPGGAAPAELAIPPGQRGRQLPTAPPTPAGPEHPHIPGVAPGQFLGRRFLKTEGVDKMRMIMKLLTLQEARPLRNALKTVEDIGDDYGGLPPPEEGAEEMPPASGEDMPIEPPVSDSAIGASTEDNVALGLLREIRDLLADLVADTGGAPEEAPELPDEEAEEFGPGEGEEEENRLEAEEEFKPGKRPMPVPNGAGGE